MFVEGGAEMMVDGGGEGWDMVWRHVHNTVGIGSIMVRI